tara:strand:- start:62224 stop:63060 length:837 start_codon:yes stop_codon:yes gene_type:complete
MGFYSHRQLKSLGQHWLNDRSVLEKILLAANLQPYDRVLEIGPGRGALTELLLNSKAKLIHAVELDPRLVKGLNSKFSGNPKFTLTLGNVLSIPLLTPEGIPANKVVANIPYNITGQILDLLIGRLGNFSSHIYDDLVLLMQKEVADRILAVPGHSSFSALSVRIQLMADCFCICNVSPKCFEPPPKVQSKVILIKPLSHQDRLPMELERKINELLSAAFHSRRKKLRNSLIKLAPLPFLESLMNEIDITLDQRPQELSPKSWIALAKAMQFYENNKN